MKQAERIKISSHPRHAVRRRMHVLLALVTVLAVATVGLGVYHSLSVGNHKEQAASLSQQLTALESQIAALESQQAINVSQLAQQEDTIQSMEQVVASQSSQLEQQNKTIATQKKQIESLKKVTTTKMTTTGKGGTKAPTKATTKATTFKPAPTTTVAVTAKATDKLIALTFDDGPDTTTTAKLLDALKARGVKATFFVLGQRINDTTIPLLQRMETEGHAIGNHSNSHKNMRNLSAADIKKELDACSNKIEKAIGHKPTIMRFPGGNYDDEARLCARNAGMAAIQWSVDTRDWESRNVTSIVNATFNNKYAKVKDGAIILMHDIYPTTVDAAIKVVDRLLKEGYTMVTVPELLTLRGGGAAPGVVYNCGA